jgi:ribosomal protein L19
MCNERRTKGRFPCPSGSYIIHHVINRRLREEDDCACQRPAQRNACLLMRLVREQDRPRKDFSAIQSFETTLQVLFVTNKCGRQPKGDPPKGNWAIIWLFLFLAVACHRRLFGFSFSWLSPVIGPMATATSSALRAVRALRISVGTRALATEGRSPISVVLSSLFDTGCSFESAKATTPKSSSSVAPYPFSSAVVVDKQQFEPPEKNLAGRPKLGKSVMDHLQATMSTSPFRSLFARRSPDALMPGSVISVETYTNAAKTHSSSFFGVLIAIRHRGVETSFTLRNSVAKTGVEMRFKLESGMIKVDPSPIHCTQRMFHV